MKTNLAPRLLIALYSVSLFEGFGKPGKVLRQERPRCCGRQIDLTRTTVCMKNVRVAGNAFTVLEPICPICRRKVPATWAVMQ